jgi:hypothetical protein
VRGFEEGSTGRAHTWGRRGAGLVGRIGTQDVRGAGIRKVSWLAIRARGGGWSAQLPPSSASLAD